MKGITMRNSEFSKIRALDLNLLKTLLVLLDQKHISKSSELLFITQPAVSKQLSKLREMFDDPLFGESWEPIGAHAKSDSVVSQSRAAM